MLSLTPQERKVLLFLISVALVGMGVDFSIKRYSKVKTFIGSSQYIAKVDINKADKHTLIAIFGIGEKLAQRIIEYREEEGDFKDIEELKKVKGITSYRYEKIKESFYVK